MFIPVNDQNPLKNISHAYVTWGLAILCAVAYLYQRNTDFNGLIMAGGLTPACLFGTPECPDETWPTVLTLVTYCFLHGDIWHLLGNLVFLLVFGDNVEDAMGHLRYLVFFVLCGVIAGLAHALAVSAGGAGQPLIGASGAISGLIGAYLVLHPKVHLWVMVLGRIPLRLQAYWVIGAWVAWQIFFLLADRPNDPTAWWAHLGGFFAGAVLILVFRKSNIELFDRNLRRPLKTS